MSREIVPSLELDQIRQKAQRIVDDAGMGPGIRALAGQLVRVCDSHEEVRGRCHEFVLAADRPITILQDLADSIVTHDSVYRPAVTRLKAVQKKAQEVTCG